ncbi:WD40/YVTN/BNR-like repeat-containing protein, partial [Ideonella sp.]|uniref:WD40/YVTN/BNR-like repeat-containing protein n=1 Tax=Ideonella sp. TaxID=1929293 RepID=UPI003BB800D8
MPIPRISTLPLAALAAATSLLASAACLAQSASPIALNAQATLAALQRPAVASQLGPRSLLQAAAQAGPRLVSVGERGLILLSDDAGATWRQAPCPVSVTLTAVRFADARHGVAVGHAGVVLTTTDGGEHWQLKLDGLKLAEIERRAANTPADQQAAARLAADGADKPWLDVLMADAQRLVVVGAYGLIMASSDGGSTWQSWRQRLDNPRELHLNSLRQRGAQWLIAGEQGLVLQSRDGGASFERLRLPYAGSYFTAELPADGSLLVAGLRGNAWRSADGGGSWQALASPVPVSITASALQADGSVLLANQAGMVLRLTDGALRPLALPPQPPLTGLLPLSAD